MCCPTGSRKKVKDDQRINQSPQKIKNKIYLLPPQGIKRYIGVATNDDVQFQSQGIVHNVQIFPRIAYLVRSSNIETKARMDRSHVSQNIKEKYEKKIARITSTPQVIRLFVSFDPYFKVHHEYHQHVQQRRLSRTGKLLD
jgi:hypothetical protein